MKKLYKLKCAVCGNFFDNARADKKCCSYECKKKKDRLKYKRYYKKKEFSKDGTCLYCNKKFIKKTNSNIYCSKKCSSDMASKRYNKISMGIIRTKGGKNENYLRLRFKVFLRDNFTCKYCGRNTFEDKVKLHVDHINPRKNGGKDEYDNLITSCLDCNLGKGDVLLDDRKHNRICNYLNKTEKSKIVPINPPKNTIRDETNES